MLEVGKTYTDASGVTRECIHVENGLAWMKKPGRA